MWDRHSRGLPTTSLLRSLPKATNFLRCATCTVARGLVASALETWLMECPDWEHKREQRQTVWDIGFRKQIRRINSTKVYNVSRPPHLRSCCSRTHTAELTGCRTFYPKEVRCELQSSQEWRVTTATSRAWKRTALHLRSDQAQRRQLPANWWRSKAAKRRRFALSLILTVSFDAKQSVTNARQRVALPLQRRSLAAALQANWR